MQLKFYTIYSKVIKFQKFIIKNKGKRQIKTLECLKGQIGCINSQKDKEGHRHLNDISKCGQMTQNTLKKLVK